MKNILNKRISFLLVFSMTLIITMFVSCNNDDDITKANAPVITEIRNYAASPNDTIVDKIVPGQWIVITGKNLENGTEILIDGVPVEFNPGLFTDTHAVIQVPSAIPFPSVPESQFNTITYVTKEGSVVFPFSVVAGPPSITSISNENAIEGDEVTIFGTNLFLVSELVFGGTEITDFTEVDDGTSISFVMPNITTSGPLSITTQSGSISTVFNVKDLTTGIISKVDDFGRYEWWGGAELASGDPNSGWPSYNPDFPGNPTIYFTFNYSDIPPGQGANWTHAIRLSDGPWVPVENLSDPIGNWAVKFEMNIPNDWTGGSICIYSSNTDYLARYEPWLKTGKFKTTGWQTVTIPLNTFSKSEGKGDAAQAITDLIDSNGNSAMQIFLHNYETSGIGFYGAFDNIRVVKINE